MTTRTVHRWSGRLEASLSLLMIVLSVACNRVGGDHPRAGEKGQKLEPIPEPPALQVEPEALGGEAGALTVVVARPTGDVWGDVRPTITFSKPIVALETLSRAPQAPASLEPPLPGEWRWIGSSSVEFVPKGLIPYATTFKVTVPAGLTAVDGTKLEQPYTYTFNTPRPAVQSVEPTAAGAGAYIWATPDQTFKLLLNQPVKDLDQHVRLELQDGVTPLGVQVVKVVDVAEENRQQEEDRAYERPSFEEWGFKNRQTRYELKARSPLPLNTAFTLVVDDKLAGQDGPLTLEKEARYPFRTYGPLQITAARGCMFPEWESNASCSYGPVVLITTNPVDPATLKGKLYIDPAVDVDWDRVEAADPLEQYGVAQPYVAIPGKFKPGTDYKIRVTPGLKDRFGQTAPGFHGTVHLDDVAPYLNIGSDVALLEASGDGALPLESVNLKTVTAEVWSIGPDEMARLLHPPNFVPGRASTRLTLDVSATPNRVRWTPVEVRKAFKPGARTGLFITRISSPELPKQNPQRVIGQVTDLAVHAKLGAKSGVVWVTSLASGGPVGNAALELFDRSGKKRWSGKTDERGTAEVPGLAGLIATENAWETPYALIAAHKNGDTGVTLSTWQGSYWPGVFGLEADYSAQTATSLGMVFAERGIYRPGESVHLKGLSRYRKLGDIRTPTAGTKVKLEVQDAKGDVIYNAELATTKYGTYSTDFTLDKEVPLGGFTINATMKVGEEELQYWGSFRVEEYRAPQFTVDVTTPATQVVAGEKLEATVLARYLFGGAMSGAPVHWSANRSSAGFVPPGNGGYEFGVLTWWWDDEAPEPSGDVFASGDGETDAVGAFRIAPGVAEAPGDKPWEYTIEAEVADVSRQRFADRASITVHPAAYYVGVHTSGTFAQTGKKTRLELIAVDPDGKRQAGAEMRLEVKRREWKNIRKKGVGNEWFTESEPVETKVLECKLTSQVEPVGCDFAPDQVGLYVLEATVIDGKGRKQVTRSSFYAIGEGWVSWQRNDADRIDLVPDKPLYDVGDTAKVLIKSPYPSAQALVTVEREGVLSRRLIQLEGAATTIDVPIDESLVPNVFVGVVLVRGRVPTDKGIETGDDPGRPAVRVGYTELKVEKRSKRLTVAVTPDATEKHPRDKVQIDLRVTDWQGKGAPAELTVWAVDEGVLRLTGYELPDPVEQVHPARGLSVRIGEPLLHLVLRRLYGEKGMSPGGSGGFDATGAMLRSNFKTTALFLPDVQTDANGHARVELTLPDNLTTFRIMAVAVTEGDRFGAGQSKVAVSRPLMALPALPRLARVGDRFEAGVVVHTQDASIRKVAVTAEATGLKLTGPAQRSVAMADGKPREVRFTFAAESPGTATLRFKVTGGTQGDAVEQKIPVVLPVSTEAVAAYGDTRDQRTEGLVPPGGVRPGIGGLELTLSSTVLGGFDETMRQLIDYPYGCLEQLSSRLVPFVALRELFGKFGVDFPEPNADEAARGRLVHDLILSWVGEETLEPFATKDPDEVVKRTVKAIEQLQNYDGGYRYWPSDGCSAAWPSAYAVLGLKRAKDAGYPVDDDGLERGITYLADTVAAGKETGCRWGSVKPDDTTRSFALYVLARAGAAKPSYYGELFERREHLPLFARAMLADAMFVGQGDRTQARQLLKELLNFAQETAETVHFEERNPRTYAVVWSSDTRTTALVLQTLTAITPEHPFVSKIARYLAGARQGDGRFRNTQEGAFSLMALVDVVRTKEKDTPDFTAKVLLGQETLASVPFRGRSMAVHREQIPIDKLPLSQQPLPLIFSKVGQGLLYYGALLRYAPFEMPTTPLDRGIIVQRWFEPYAGGGQTKTFKAGELVRVRVRVATPMERHFVATEVPLPAGLEAVDTSLASTAGLRSSQGEEGPGEGYEYESEEESEEGESAGRWAEQFYSPFNHVEKRDDRVVLFADDLPPGVHVSSFVARATTPGEFVLKPAQAEEMYSPEVFGRSDGGRFLVIPGEVVAGR